jgi:acyl-CoA thioesterase FadM
VNADEHRSWWSTERRLWWRDFDELGHLSAARYADLYQEAVGDFVVSAWEDADASYVVARLDITYLHEIRREGSPVVLQVSPRRIGRSSFVLSMAVSTADGLMCSRADGTYVAWDPKGRCSRAMTEAERSGLSSMTSPGVGRTRKSAYE